MENLVIYGAGEAGRQIFNEIKKSKSSKIVALIDDYPEGVKITDSDLPIFHSRKIPEIIKTLKVDCIYLAIPSLDNLTYSMILNQLFELGVAVKSLPMKFTLQSDLVNENMLSVPSVENIIGKRDFDPNTVFLNEAVSNKKVLVTGGAGSIGSELVRQLIKFGAENIFVVDSNEYNLYKLEDEIKGDQVHFILGDITQSDFLKTLFKKINIDLVLHAAAYKHVPLVESNVLYSFFNNVMGLKNIAELSIKLGVEKFILISSDKAVNPLNYMGASKRVCELIIQSLSSLPSNTTFCSVRFGNVLGSSGSVIPLFTKQILTGGPVTVTDKKAVRYFMSIPEAANLVLQAGAMIEQGSIYLLDMGEPVNIQELAMRLILLHGKVPSFSDTRDTNKIQIIYTGLRPGEKLYEELYLDKEQNKTSHPMIFKVSDLFQEKNKLKGLLDEFYKTLNRFDEKGLKQILSKLVPEKTI